MEVVYRPLGADDVENVRWALYAALAWDPALVLPPRARVVSQDKFSWPTRGPNVG